MRGRKAPQIKCAVFSNFAVLFSTASLLQKKKEVLPLMILSNHFETAPYITNVEWHLVSMAYNILKLHHKIQSGRLGTHLVVPNAA